MLKCAFDCGDLCSALVEKKCKDCLFFKTPEMLNEGRMNAIGTILRRENGMDIIKKYGELGFLEQYRKREEMKNELS